MKAGELTEIVKNEIESRYVEIAKAVLAVELERIEKSREIVSMLEKRYAALEQMDVGEIARKYM